MNIGQHHQSSRRRNIARKSPHSQKMLTGIDALAYAVSILSLFFTIDQVRIIWINHNASGVSLLSWIFYTVSAAVWFVYGHIHKDKVILITNGVWVAFSAFIVVGVALYGGYF